MLLATSVVEPHWPPTLVAHCPSTHWAELSPVPVTDAAFGRAPDAPRAQDDSDLPATHVALVQLLRVVRVLVVAKLGWQATPT